METLSKYILKFDFNKNILIKNQEKLNIFLKKNIFLGKIIIFKNNKIIEKLISKAEEIVNNNCNLDDLLHDKIQYEEKNLLILKIQNEIKNSFEIQNLFKSFLFSLKFNLQDTYGDKICLRYISSDKNLIYGNLKHTNAHRDTWASNLFEQINWWFPMHNIKDSNTLYIAPNYFNKPIANSSKDWNFKYFILNKKKYPSTPTTNKKLSEKEKLIIKINRGDILCFSGTHLHGSNRGKDYRLSFETRTICKNDKYNYLLPKNVDSMGSIKKNNWFRNFMDKKKL